MCAHRLAHTVYTPYADGMTNNHRITRDDLPRVRFTAYVRTRMTERRVTEADIARALVQPDIVEPSRNPRNGKPQTRYVRGDLVVVFDPGSWTIVTLLLRSASQWDDHDMRNRDR